MHGLVKTPPRSGRFQRHRNHMSLDQLGNLHATHLRAQQLIGGTIIVRPPVRAGSSPSKFLCRQDENRKAKPDGLITVGYRIDAMDAAEMNRYPRERPSQNAQNYPD